MHKCSYCDFYSFTRYESRDFTRWRERIVGEVNESREWLSASLFEPPPVTSLFLGGGTPSLLPVLDLQGVLAALERRFAFAKDAEITIEANPETISPEWCRFIVEETPINRVSLGAQSFQTKYLETLERQCSPEAIRKAVKMLRAAGMEDLNLDLIFAIPGQSQAEALADIDAALELEPDHLSFYNLTLKPGHSLYAKLPEDDFAADVYEAGIAHLAKRGFEQYEISNFSRPGRPSRHNLLYWTGGDYLGLGPSAAGRIFKDGVFHHRKAFSDFSKYLESPAYPGGIGEQTSPEETRLEAVFLELRLNQGIQLSDFTQRYGYDLTTAKNFGLFEKEGLIEREGDTLRLTARGRLLADRVTRDLVD